jgi:hypothetical protein
MEPVQPHHVVVEKGIYESILRILQECGIIPLDYTNTTIKISKGKEG